MKENSREEDIECIQEFLEYSQDMINDMDYERPVDVTIYQNQINSLEHILSDYKREIDDKEVFDALHMLLHCSLKDTEYETQKQQFKIVNAYIKKLEKENEEWQGAYQEEKDKSFELVRENQKLEAENEELREEIDLYEDNIILLQKKLIDTEKRLLNYILEEKGE